MNRYLIKSITEVFLHDFNDGECNFVRCYNLEGEFEAETPREAVLKLIEEMLAFTDGYLDEDMVDGNPRVYYTKVDDDNSEASETQIEAWKRGEIDLYNSCTRFKVFQLVEHAF